jgi:Cu/Ag efflux pump CusA
MDAKQDNMYTRMTFKNTGLHFELMNIITISYQPLVLFQLQELKIFHSFSFSILSGIRSILPFSSH